MTTGSPLLGASLSGMGTLVDKLLKFSSGRPAMLWTRRFAALSLLCVLATASISAALLSRNVAERMVWRNAELAQEFLDSLVRMQHGDKLFARDHDPKDFEALFGELARMPGLVHTNVFDKQRRLVWSTNRAAIGQDTGPNEGLEAALGGKLALESKMLEPTSFIKPEHAFIPSAARDAIEVYIPVHDARQTVVGVAELYMEPVRLVRSVHEMTRDIWLACAASGLLTYLALVGLVMRADREIARQQRTIVTQESLAAVGDMASAVAHGLRNPLGSIRSSAELMATGPEASTAQDIMSEVDRLQTWIHKLLAYAQQSGRQPAAVDLAGLCDAVLQRHRVRADRQKVRLVGQLPAGLPPVLADQPALEQALDNLVANAIDAMPDGGELRLNIAQHKRHLELQVADTGTGIAPGDLERVFVPFHTTKRTGLGVGLPLARRTIERSGGSLRLLSTVGEGTLAVLTLPVAPANTTDLGTP
jgi:two-component system, NtrC family, sensor histidine kinase HydH